LLLLSILSSFYSLLHPHDLLYYFLHDLFLIPFLVFSLVPFLVFFLVLFLVIPSSLLLFRIGYIGCGRGRKMMKDNKDVRIVTHRNGN